MTARCPKDGLDRDEVCLVVCQDGCAWERIGEQYDHLVGWDRSAFGVPVAPSVWRLPPLALPLGLALWVLIVGILYAVL